MNGMPYCTPTVNTAFNVLGGYTLAVPTLPATYSFSFGPSYNICGAAFESWPTPWTRISTRCPGASAVPRIVGGLAGEEAEVQSSSRPP